MIDEQKGLAVGFSNFYHDSKLKTATLKGIPGVDSVPSYQGFFNMPAMRFFTIKKGRIYDIEATGLAEAYGTKTVWEEDPAPGVPSAEKTAYKKHWERSNAKVESLPSQRQTRH